MILFRRILAGYLIAVSVILLITLLPISQLDNTAGNPKFYKDRIRQADLYNFVYDEVLPTGLDELHTGELSDSPIDISGISSDIVSVAMKILPPDWLQAQAETAIDTIVPYFTGDIDAFTLTIDLGDRIETVAEVVKKDVIRKDTFTHIYDDSMSYLAKKLDENQDKAPYPLSLSKGEIEISLMMMVPEGWLAQQAEAAVESFMPYLRGETDSFTITFYLRDLVDEAAAAAIDLFTGQETYDYLLDELITPVIQANIGEEVALPYGITLSEEEITSTVKEVLPLPWVRERLQDVINSAAAYIKGETDSVNITIDPGDRKAMALELLTELADRKLESRFYSLPECSMSRFLQIVQSLPPNTPPDCRPAGISYDEAKAMLDIDIAGSVDRTIGARIPDTWIYTDADLRQSLGEGNEHLLDDARVWVSEGWTFTDADLLDELDMDERDTLDDVRGWIENGYIFTETDLREAISDDNEDLRPLDEARRWTGTARTWLWFPWLAYFLILALIGLLGGRNWRSRPVWSLSVMFFTSLILLVFLGLIYPIAWEPRIHEIGLDLADYEATEVVLAAKGNEVITNVFDSFLAGLIIWSRYQPTTGQKIRPKEPPGPTGNRPEYQA